MDVEDRLLVLLVFIFVFVVVWFGLLTPDEEENKTPEPVTVETPVTKEPVSPIKAGCFVMDELTGVQVCGI